MPNSYTHSSYAWFLHTFPPWLILAHIRTNNFSSTSSPFIHTMPFRLVTSMTFLELVPLVQWKFWNPFAPINGLPILQGPMRIWEWMAIQLKLGWESLVPMEHKRYFILQSKRITIFMTNGIGGSNLPLILDILMRFLVWFYLFHPLTSHPTSSS
jgi:hypothetical protein